MRKNLISARKKSQLIQKDLAKAINISETHYQRLEAGTSDGSIKVWQKLSEILGETVDYLIN